MSARRNSEIKKRKYAAHSADYVSTSKVELDTFSIHWSIQNFSELKDDVSFYSPVYRGWPKTNHSWNLSVKPNTLDSEFPEDTEKYLSVHLYLNKIRKSQFEETSVKVTFKISILNKEGEPAITEVSKTDESDALTEGDHWGYSGFILMNMLDPAEILFDDTLTIHCRLWIQHDFKHSTLPGGQALVSLTKEALDDRVVKQLRLDFKEGFEAGAFTDMTLVTNTKTFKTHKFVLAARSQVFKAMLSSVMQESTQNSVEIEDFDEETVKSMLLFVYTGEITALSTDQACDLLRMADKYEVLGLREYLEEFLGHKLDTSNVLKVLATADMHGASKLKTAALRFTNKYKEILLKTADFKELVRENPNLICELYELV